MKKLLLMISILALALIFPVRSSAISFTSALESIKAEASPGQLINRNFQLTLSKDDRPTQFKIHVDDWWRSEDGKQSFYKPAGTLVHSCAKWITLNPTEVLVEPGAQLSVRLSIMVPSDIKPGGYWCVLTVDEVSDPLAPKPKGVGISFLSSVSVGVFINVTPVNRAASVRSIEIDAGEAVIVFGNDGNCPVGIEGRMEFIRPGEKDAVATVVIPRSTILTEPITTDKVTLDLTKSTIEPGRYLVRAIYDIGLDHLMGVQKEMDLTREMLRPKDKTQPAAK